MASGGNPRVYPEVLLQWQAVEMRLNNRKEL